jgi:hypothetical protein
MNTDQLMEIIYFSAGLLINLPILLLFLWAYKPKNRRGKPDNEG